MPDPALQLVAPLPGVRDQVPTTTPLLSVPVVLVVPLEVPVNELPCSNNCKTLPLMVEAMVKPSVPVTWLVVMLVPKFAVPATVTYGLLPAKLVPMPVGKHAPEL